MSERLVTFDSPTLCRFCGSEGNDPELQNYEAGGPCKIYEVEFECGTIFQFTNCSGQIISYFWENQCKQRDIH